ncbi:hypothetical protein GIB67_041493 [Kingdonia uniflora]|uniref:Uncharacterized protein n=1 Tax=Kingdonia uniflora TaxID=39325 RepID=A0A7J7MQI8_9MAGN|nr:hypothetical protein GIB67_041493 [Kingdonia uniflora]
MRAASLYHRRGSLREAVAARLPEVHTLDLSNNVFIKEFPKEFEKFIHLRYLDLSCTGVEELPEVVTNLSNLQTLRLNCSNLRRLTNEIGNLVSLRQLEVDGKKLEEVPETVGNLSNLQVGLHGIRWLTAGDQVYPCKGDAVLSNKDPSAAHSTGGFYNSFAVCAWMSLLRLEHTDPILVYVFYALALQEFNLKKPSAYHYDILLLGFMVLLCALIGLPPSNGVLPQSPMHTKSSVVLKKQLIRKKKKDGTKRKRMHKAHFINFFCADPDMLEVGNGGMTFEEYCAHFSIWFFHQILSLLSFSLGIQSNMYTSSYLSYPEQIVRTSTCVKYN